MVFSVFGVKVIFGIMAISFFIVGFVLFFFSRVFFYFFGLYFDFVGLSSIKYFLRVVCVIFCVKFWEYRRDYSLFLGVE